MIQFLFLLISSIWIPVGDSYQEIPITYGEIKVCAGYSAAEGAFIKGCWQDQSLQFHPYFIYSYDSLAGSVWNHEVQHAWGIGHSEMLWWTVEGQYR